ALLAYRAFDASGPGIEPIFRGVPKMEAICKVAAHGGRQTTKALPLMLDWQAITFDLLPRSSSRLVTSGSFLEKRVMKKAVFAVVAAAVALATPSTLTAAEI